MSAPLKRDPAFLRMAILAASGGVISIVVSIGLPIWMAHHGRPYSPAFSLFSGWGIFALCGAAACLRTYYGEKPLAPPPGPRGGVVIAPFGKTRAASQREPARRDKAA